MKIFALKCDFNWVKCGKLRWKCAKLSAFQGLSSGISHFSTLSIRGKVEKTSSYYTIVKNSSVEKIKFWLFHLTGFIHLEWIYSPRKKIFLSILHKNQLCARCIKAPTLIIATEIIKCSMYVLQHKIAVMYSLAKSGAKSIFKAPSSARIVSKSVSLITQ